MKDHNEEDYEEDYGSETSRDQEEKIPFFNRTIKKVGEHYIVGIYNNIKIYHSIGEVFELIKGELND